MFRQRSNGLQTVRSTALSHAETARTPTPETIAATLKWRQETSGERTKEDAGMKRGRVNDSVMILMTWKAASLVLLLWFFFFGSLFSR